MVELKMGHWYRLSHKSRMTETDRREKRVSTYRNIDEYKPYMFIGYRRFLLGKTVMEWLGPDDGSSHIFEQSGSVMLAWFKASEHWHDRRDVFAWPEHVVEEYVW